jgi:hypothetical protein
MVIEPQEQSSAISDLSTDPTRGQDDLNGTQEAVNERPTAKRSWWG